MKKMHEMLADFEFNDPASEDQILAFERSEGMRLPDCYRDFLKIGNGGEGPVGKLGYASFWRVEEIAGLNRDYRVREYLPGYLVIGSDGGGEAFAIKRDEVGYVQVPFVGLGLEDCIAMGVSFGEFIDKLSKGQ